MSDPILDTLRDVMELPSFPVVVGRLQAVLDSPDPSVQEAAALVIEDPGIASRVVKLAASTAYNPMGAPVETVEQAVSRVGLRELRILVAAAGVAGACSSFAEEELRRNVWMHSLTSGIAAGLLVQYCQELPPQPPRANPYFLAGLTHDIGALLLAGLLGERHHDLLEESGVTGVPVHELERLEVGFCHGQAGAALLADWGLPDSIVAIARHHHEPDKAPEEHRTDVILIHVAEWLAEHRGYGWGEVGATLCDGEWERLGMSFENVGAVMEAFDEAAKNSQELLSVIES